MDEIRWEDPPGKRGTRGRWVTKLEPLKAHPKRWARIADKRTASTAANAAKNLRLGIVKGPSGRWEYTYRQAEPGVFAVYARYLGEGDA